jgi:hypothetical protein
MKTKGRSLVSTRPVKQDKIGYGITTCDRCGKRFYKNSPTQRFCGSQKDKESCSRLHNNESWKKYKHTDWYKSARKRFRENHKDYFKKYIKEYMKTYKISKEKALIYRKNFINKHPNYYKNRRIKDLSTTNK